MATYPSININTATSATRQSIEPSNVFIYGFADRGPSNIQHNILSVTEFLNVYGIPQTDAEYSMYEAVNNALRAGGRALCYKLPYVKQYTDISATTDVTYYCDNSQRSMLSTDIQQTADSMISDTDDSATYISTAIQDSIGKSAFSSAISYAWQQYPEYDITSDNVMSVTLKCITDARTVFDAADADIHINSDKHKSLGIIPIFVGSVNMLFTGTNRAGMQTLFKDKLHAAVYSNLLHDDIFTTELLKEYDFSLTANDLYVDCLDIISATINFDLTDLRDTRQLTGVLVAEILLDAEHKIQINILEMFVGMLNGKTVQYGNIVEDINFYSKFIKMSTNNIQQIDNESWHFVDVPSAASPLHAIGLYASCYDTGTDAYAIHSDSIFNTAGISDHINALLMQTKPDDIFCDYIVMPSIVDCFNYTDISAHTASVRQHNGISYNSAEYLMQHNLAANLDAVQYDKYNVKALMLMASKFRLLDKDSTVFIDLPLKLTADLQHISSNISATSAQVAASIITKMSEVMQDMQIPIVTQFDNTMFVFNHQYVDKYDRTDEYALIPPSVMMLFAYAYYDTYKVAAPIAGSNVAHLFVQCHKGYINNKHRILFKTLFDAYMINSLMSDMNNSTFPIQQMLCRNARVSIFAQHHAFRVAKYLKRHIKRLARQYLHELHTLTARQRFAASITQLCDSYKSNGVLSDFMVVADESINTDVDIDNSTLNCIVAIEILGAIVKVNVNITQLDVHVSIG